MLGFQLDFWGFAAFAFMAFVGVVFLGALIFLLGLPGRIAIARNHPEAEAVYFMGWVGFLAVVRWIQALIWALKPTDIVDIRNLPRETRRETEEQIARLRTAPFGAGKGAEDSGSSAP